MAVPDKLNSSLDLNNLDPEKIVRLLLENQTTLLKAAVIIGALVVGGSMFSDYHTKSEALHTQMTQAQAKIDVIKNRDTALADINTFKSLILNNLNETELITLISKFAKLYDVDITALTPGDSKDMGLYDVINVNISALSDNFKNVLLFLRKIEKSKFPLRIDSWSGNEQEAGKILFSIKISAVLIHTT